MISVMFQPCQRSFECSEHPFFLSAQPYLSGLTLTQELSTISNGGWYELLVSVWRYLLSSVSAVSNEKGPGKQLRPP